VLITIIFDLCLFNFRAITKKLSKCREKKNHLWLFALAFLQKHTFFALAFLHFTVFFALAFLHLQKKHYLCTRFSVIKIE